MLLKDFNHESCICQVCKGKPDEVYFRKLDSGEVDILAVICTSCKEAYEATIKSIGRAICSDPDCDQC